MVVTVDSVFLQKQHCFLIITMMQIAHQLTTIPTDIDLVFAGYDAPQVNEDFPGNYKGKSTDNSQNIDVDVGPGSSFVFWNPSNKHDTLQCYKSKGRFSSTSGIENNQIETIYHGHAFFYYFETDKVTVDGSNAKVQITTPGFYLSQGGTTKTISDPGFTDVTYTQLEGTWLDICAEVSSGGGESSSTSSSCEEKEEEDDCIADDNCMWKKKKGCISMPWGERN